MFKTRFILFYLICITFFASCTIEKRTYMKGFHVEWKNKSNQNIQNSTSIEKDLFQTNESKSNPELITPAQNISNSILVEKNSVNQSSIPVEKKVTVNFQKKSEVRLENKNIIKRIIPSNFSKKNKHNNGLLAKDNEKFGKGWFYILISLLIVGCGFFARAVSQTYLIGNIFFIVALVLFIYGLYLMFKYA